jgi:uncharacterized protein (TIGR00297 family)
MKPAVLSLCGVLLIVTSLADRLRGELRPMGKPVPLRARVVLALCARGLATCAVIAAFLRFKVGVATLESLGIGALLASQLLALSELPLRVIPLLLAPLLAAGYLRIAMAFRPEELTHHLIACGGALAIVVISRFRRYLTRDGVFSGWLVLYATWGLGGAHWFAPIMALFLSANWIGKLVIRLTGRKPPKEKLEKKGGERDYQQVFANVGTCVALVLVKELLPPDSHLGPMLFGAYMGGICAATADTVASEVGVLSRARPVLLWTFRPVPAGESGGVTLLGYFAAALGAATPVLVLLFAGGGSWFSARLLWVALACGLVGSTVDSVVGATLQSKRKCEQCQLVLERDEHCGRATRPHSGWSWVTNDVVNAIGSTAGLILGALLS